MTARRLSAGVVVALAALLAFAAGASATTYTVNTTSDVQDGVCDAHCSLRDAITLANASTMVNDEIDFSGPGITTPATPLPPITDTTTVNGMTGAGCTGTAELVVIDGNSGDFNALEFGPAAGGSRVCRLNIRDFDFTAITIESDDTTVTGCLLGTNAAGTTAEGNGGGVDVAAGADGTVIGGDLTDVNVRNVISGNTVGVGVFGTASDTTIAGNYIGTNNTAAGAIANGTGVDVSATATATTIGGDTATERNIISGNTTAGVDVGAGSTVIGNYIGTNLAGDDEIPNGDGVQAATGAQIGGSAAQRNVISGNADGVFISGAATVEGNWIGPNAAGTAALTGQTDGVEDTVGAADETIAGNVIAGNAVGINLAASSGADITANTIGLAPDGVTAMPNGAGIDIGTGVNITIGGGGVAEGNTIAGNTGDGINTNGDDTLIEGNVIGLDAAGDAAGNERGIVFLFGSEGGDVIDNVISGNDQRGVLLGQDTAGVAVQGNVIGLDADGAAAPNGSSGVTLDKTEDALIGGPDAGDGNVISGNSGTGISLAGGVSTSPRIEGNLIGTDPTGMLDRGNLAEGILGSQATGLEIVDNVISGNGGEGIFGQMGAPDAVYEGNLIGVATNGTSPLGNDGAGVRVGSPGTTADATTIDGNTIAHNGEDGVAVSDTATGAAILRNSIHSNGATDGARTGIGIDLGDEQVGPDDDGVTGNDDDDGDGGANGLQNFPELTFAETNGVATTVTGTIDSTPGREFRVEVFSSASCDPSGNGQGEVFIGATTLAADETGFTIAANPTSAGRVVTATATDLTTDQTSEFSECFAVTAAPVPPDTGGGDPPPDSGSLPADPGAPIPPSLPGPVLPAPVPKFPAKISVLRAGVDDGYLDMLVDITSRAVTDGAELELDYHSAGRHTRFSVPIRDNQIKIRKRLPSSQRGKDTGIVTLEYAGNDVVLPDDARLRAADGKSKLVRSRSQIVSGELRVSGTIVKAARGVARIRLSFDRPDGTTGFLNWNARIAKGKWSLSEDLPAEAAHGGQLSIQFTGYEKKNLRGEQAAKQVLA